MRFPLVNFAKGEVSDDIISRFDVQAYASAVKRARNVKVKKYGGLEKRPGTRFVAEVKDASQPVRLFPFQFSLTQTYALEMGQGYMRVAANGGLVLEERLTIEAITNGNPAVVTAAFHGFETGDEVFFDGIEGMTELNGRILPVTVLSDSTFSVPVNATGYGAFTADTGGITRTEEPAPPPPPPPVPDPVPPPPPPPTGGGGGRRYFDYDV
ncbi:ubiquitin-activating E1 FCCH domain-containing protein [Sphingomonas turrisvirgatae]|uniref:Ubiquitin-activating enzyme E1 FCCH domain-containing protein n=1 Tax=Sphingomonas turrisvirgatae TaxID=1888892 RepID=A0A1E3LZM2_9SPHN|nr:ubiquitin-activating E1 FCCH domain-containing protein [Sphingomonas turrisvirgatae]ODP39256.1 hypothetical protein BFL28_10610 [Sphingomonas turrisvirgatae]